MKVTTSMNKPVPCHAIIFDFDGTLADSMPFLEKIGVQIMMKYYDISHDDATKRYRTTTGLPYEHQIKLNFPDAEQNDDAINEFEKLKIDRIFEQQLFDDSVETLDEIKKEGILIFVSSSTFQSTIEEYFERKGIADRFTEIVGYKPGFEKGAHHFNHIKNKYSIDLNEAVFVGDSLKDFERSKGYCQFIAIERMFKASDFRKLGHEGYIVKSLSEIPPLLQPIV